MPVFKQGNMWESYDISDMFIITGNSFIRNNGSLAMGRGIALETRNRIPKIDKFFGKMIIDKCGHLGIYHLLKYNKIYLLQTKIHFKDPSSIQLINDSVEKLKKIIHPQVVINMVFPGVGYGGLDKAEVFHTCLSNLPRNVTIWYT